MAFLPSRVRITWFEVPAFATSDKNTFQVTLFENGRVAVVYGDVATEASIVGVAPFGELDLTLLDFDADLPFPPERTVIAERDDPDEIFLGATASTMVIVGHEFGHLWLAFPRYVDADGNLSSAHRAGPHWSFYMDAEGSLMHGNDWNDNGDGTFSATTGAHTRYSPLDRYLMGLAPAGTVPDFYYVAGTNESRFSLPTIDSVISGDRVDVSVDDVIAAEGERRPAFAASPKSFRTAFLVVGLVGQGVSPESVAKIERYRQRWTRYFQEATDFRGEVRTAIFPR